MMEVDGEPDRDEVRVPSQVERNIAAISRIDQAALEQRTLADRIGGSIGRFVGSLTFVVLQVAFFVAWMVINRAGAAWQFDPYPYILLMLIVAFEAILLSTFVLMQQQYMQRLSDRRANLNLQVDLLAESEMTKVLKTLQAVTDYLGMPGAENDPEMRDLSTRTEIERVAQVIDEQLEAGDAVTELPPEE